LSSQFVIQTSYNCNENIIDDELSNYYNCRKCNKNLASRQSRHKHEKICKNNLLNEKIKILSDKVEMLENKTNNKLNNNCNNNSHNNSYNTITDNRKQIFINYSPGTEWAKLKIIDF
jgi:hypothetical protein